MLENASRHRSRSPSWSPPARSAPYWAVVSGRSRWRSWPPPSASPRRPAWLVFAFSPSNDLAVAAGGLTACALAEVATLYLARARRRTHDADALLDRARARIAPRDRRRDGGVHRGAAALARPGPRRLDVTPRRGGAPGRRGAPAGPCRPASARPGTSSPTCWPRQSNASNSGCAPGLPTSSEPEQNLETRAPRADHRQRAVLAEAEARVHGRGRGARLDLEEQRASVLRMREELERAAQAALSEALEELEAHTPSAAA